jgi:DNA polymerase IIIc chi subunit
MTNQATFYSLSPELDKFEFSSKLASQLWRKQQTQGENAIPLWVLCDNQAALNRIDDLLWNHQKDSFIPHQIIQHYTEFKPENQHIIISMAMPTPQWEGIMINLSPYSINQFKNNNIIEIIGNQEQEKIIGRECYRRYQKLNYTITHHKI